MAIAYLTPIKREDGTIGGVRREGECKDYSGNLWPSLAKIAISRKCHSRVGEVGWQRSPGAVPTVIKSASIGWRRQTETERRRKGPILVNSNVHASYQTSSSSSSFSSSPGCHCLLDSPRTADAAPPSGVSSKPMKLAGHCRRLLALVEWLRRGPFTFTATDCDRRCIRLLVSAAMAAQRLGQ